MSDNVISIGDWQIKRSSEHRIQKDGDCDHKHLELDERGDVVRCLKCGTQVSAFWAIKMISEQYNCSLRKLASERETVKQAKEENLHLLAAKKVEKAWRRRSMVPACPHCGRGIFPEDGLGGSMINREMELRRRKAEFGNKHPVNA